MCAATATASPVVETVSRRRVVSATEIAAESAGRTTPEFWEFLEKMTPEMWAGDYMLYICREDPKPSNYGGTNTLEKCAGYIEVRPGVRLALDSREDVELAIKEKFGGKAFRLILKKGRERITEGKCVNEALPKYPADMGTSAFSGQPANTQHAPGDPNAIASKAIDAVTGQQPEAINIAVNALRATSEILMKSAAAPTTASSSPDSDLDRAFKQAMIAKLLAPERDPFEMFIKFKELERSSGNGNANPLVDKLLNAAVDRFMNPVPAVTGRTTLLDLGREVIPAVASVVKDSLHEWRLGMEAQRDGVAMMSGKNPGAANPPGAAAPAPTPRTPEVLPASTPVPPQTGASAATPQTAAESTSAAPSFHWVESKIVEIVRDLDYTVDQAVDETLGFLYRVDAAIVPLLIDPPKLDQRLAAGEEGLLQLFQFEPILRQVPVGPRLTEFIKKFRAAAIEEEAKRIAPDPAKPAS